MIPRLRRAARTVKFLNRGKSKRQQRRKSRCAERSKAVMKFTANRFRLLAQSAVIILVAGSLGFT